MYRVWISTYCPRGEYDELDTYSVETWGETLDVVANNSSYGARVDIQHLNGNMERIK